MTGSTSRAEVNRGFLDGWTRAGMYAAVLGALLVIVGLTTRTAANPVEAQVVALHNARAENGSRDECPPEPAWHFVLAPNNGTFSFVRIVLDLDGTVVTFDADEVLRNGGQADNVFVPVPDGYSLRDLNRSGSFAEVIPVGTVKFVLSHVCDGHPTDSTTTTTTSATTTTKPPKHTTTTTPATTTTTTKPPKHTTTTTTPATTTTKPPKHTTTTTTPATTTTTTTTPATTTTTPATTTTTTATTTTTTTTTPGTTTTTTTPDTTTTTTAGTTTTTVAESTTTTVEQLAPPTTTTTTTTTTTPPGSTTSTISGPTTTSPTTPSTTVPRTIVVTGSGSSRTLLMLGTLMMLVGTSLVLGSYGRRVSDEVTRT